MSLISADEANRVILSHSRSYGLETVSIDDCLGRILAEDIIADRDFPPFNRVTMDGICIRRIDFEEGKRNFIIKGTIQAGEQAEVQIDQGTCVEIMTGASLPESTVEKGLVVIRYEDTAIDNGNAKVTAEILPLKNNVHNQGEDKLAGDLLVQAGSEIRAAEVNILGTVGCAKIAVRKMPKVAVISTGNELVAVDKIPLPHQIRKSNSYGISAFLSNYCSSISQIHLKDDEAEILMGLGQAINQYDIVVLSGGVSKGKFDFIPDALHELGVKKEFHGVAQRPGKPFWFGAKNDTVVFALPGNPVSAMAGTCRYIIPMIKNGLGIQPLEYQRAVLTEQIVFTPKLTRFLEAQITSDENGQLLATPVIGNGSGDFTRLLQANAFIELPAETSQFEKGALISFFRM